MVVGGHPSAQPAVPGWLLVVGKAQVLDYTAKHASAVVDDGRAMAVADTGLLVQVASAGKHVLALGEGWQALPYRHR